MPTRWNRAAAAGALSAACLLIVPAAADAEVIGTAKASGASAAALVSASAQKPTRLYVRVKAKPRQRVSVTWHVTCSKRGDGGSEDGTFTARTTVKRKLRLPMRKPDTCSASTKGQLTGSGRITVQLLAR